MTEKKAPRKTVTIREVNKELYDHFVSLSHTFGKNTGEAFSKLISHYKQYYAFSGHRRHHHGLFHRENVDIISDLDELTISKEDLEATPNVKYVFRKIKKLKFDESVDNQTLLEKVVVIRRSKVTGGKDLSKLFLLSTQLNREVELYPDSETKDVTIRNVDTQVYDEFVSKCQMEGITIRQAVNDILNKVIMRMETIHIIKHELHVQPQELIVVNLMDEVTVNNQDLVDIHDRKVLFNRIENLIFGDDVEKDQFVEKVIGVFNCQNVELPESIPKLTRLSRIKKIKMETS